MTKFKNILPDSLSVLGIDVTLEQKKLKGAKGEFNGAIETIAINPDFSCDIIKRSLVHELVHSILYFSGIHNLVDLKTEEAICDAVETGLTPLVEFKFEKRGAEAPPKD